MNRVTLSITPSRNFETKLSYILKYSGNYTIPINEFYPYLDEVIPIKIPHITARKSRIISDKYKKNYNIKSIVGKRINLLWNNGNYYPATVIGYTTNMLYSLVYFDERTIDKATNTPVLPGEDFYKLKLFKSGDGKVEKWSLFSDS